MGDAFWKYSSIKTIVVDKGYSDIFSRYINDILGKIIHIGNKIGKCYRYVLERMFSWFGDYRRLSKDYEYTISSTESFIMIPHSMMLLKRLCC